MPSVSDARMEESAGAGDSEDGKARAVASGEYRPKESRLSDDGNLTYGDNSAETRTVRSYPDARHALPLQSTPMASLRQPHSPTAPQPHSQHPQESMQAPCIRQMPAPAPERAQPLVQLPVSTPFAPRRMAGGGAARTRPSAAAPVAASETIDHPWARTPSTSDYFAMVETGSADVLPSQLSARRSLGPRGAATNHR